MNKQEIERFIVGWQGINEMVGVPAEQNTREKAEIAAFALRNYPTKLILAALDKLIATQRWALKPVDVVEAMQEMARQRADQLFEELWALRGQVISSDLIFESPLASYAFRTAIGKFSDLMFAEKKTWLKKEFREKYAISIGEVIDTPPALKNDGCVSYGITDNYPQKPVFIGDPERCKAMIELINAKAQKTLLVPSYNALALELKNAD